MVKRRSTGESNGDSSRDRLLDEDFFEEWPTVWEYLSETRFDDGKPRETSTVLIFVDAERLKVCLSDREANEVAFVSGATFKEAMDALERGLAGGTLDWRPGKRKGK